MIVFLSNISDNQWRTSLGVQGLRLLNLLPVQRVWVQSLNGETPSNLHCSQKNPKNKKTPFREFSAGPVVRTLRSHSQGFSIPGQGTKIP